MFFYKSKSEEPIKINKKVHILTLDSRWHELFKGKKSRKISELEKKLNKLMGEQGQLTNDLKEYSLLKKKLMSDIMDNMKDAFEEEDNYAIKEMDKSKKYINDIKSKLEKIEGRIELVPEEIEKINKELLGYSMQDCYMRMFSTKSEMDELEQWIEQIRVELKDKVVRKTVLKEEYDKLYSYMHDLVGYEIIEQYDNRYLGAKK
jgi:archaellum component FlaC